MPRAENTPAVLACSVLAPVVALGLSCCSTLVDEIRIRTDPNTIVKPDVDELRELEMATGTYDLEKEALPARKQQPALVDDLYRATHPGVISRRKERPRRGEAYVPRAFAPSAPSQPPSPEAQGGGTLLPDARSYGQGYGAVVPQATAPIPQAAAPPQPGRAAPAYNPAIIEELR